MAEHVDDSPLTYLNKGQVYWISIVDTAPLSAVRPTKYRTSIRITFEAEEHRHNPIACWKRWEETLGVSESDRRKLPGVEYAAEPATSAHCELLGTYVKLYTASLDGFSDQWTVCGQGDVVRCYIPVKFNVLSSDFSHSKALKDSPVRLCVQTQMGDSSLSFLRKPGEAAEMCHCKVRVFRAHEAERKLSDEYLHVKRTIENLKQRMSQEEVHVGSLANKYHTRSSLRGPAATNRYDVNWQKRIWSKASTEENNEFDEEESHLTLQTLQDKLLSTKRVSSLNLPGDKHDETDLYLIRHLWNQIGDQETSFLTGENQESRPPSMRSRSSNSVSLIDGNGNGGEHFETSFWTGGNQNYRPPSMQSGSSSMNSSLHGTPRFDPEEQNPVFVPSPRSRLQKSSSYYDERSSPHPPSVRIGPYEYDASLASIPYQPLLPPRHLAGLSCEGRPYEAAEGPPTLPPPPVELERNPSSSFDCDICGETVKVDSPREWQ